MEAIAHQLRWYSAAIKVYIHQAMFQANTIGVTLFQSSRIIQPGNYIILIRPFIPTFTFSLVYCCLLVSFLFYFGQRFLHSCSPRAYLAQYCSVPLQKGQGTLTLTHRTISPFVYQLGSPSFCVVFQGQCSYIPRRSPQHGIQVPKFRLFSRTYTPIFPQQRTS